MVENEQVMDFMARLHDLKSSRLPLVELDGYQIFHLKASSSAHGGLITYVDDKYDVSVIKKIDNSLIWDGLFLKLKHEKMQNAIIIGNLYKPPRNNNNIANISAFKEELEPILQELDITNSEVVICGDFNINILKVNEESHFSEFLDTMLGYSLYPKITFPTRLNNNSGATLIDNIYCKLSSRSVESISGIIIDPMSDHFPYFVCLDILNRDSTKSTKLMKKRINNKLAIENMVNEMRAMDISQEFDENLTSDPNYNYDILHDHIQALKNKHLPVRLEKFHKHRHKKNNWITYGILRSIKFRDEMYMRFKTSTHNSTEFLTLKNNLRVFNSILKRTIREAKIHYYNEVFETNKQNIKATWKYISEIICKSSNKRISLDKIIFDTKMITDPK